MMEKLFAELRRRNVFRATGVYAVIAWLLIQVVVAIKASLSLPAWTDTLIIVLFAIGFPIALILAWAFEMTPEGMKLTANVAEGESIALKTGKALGYVIIVGLALAAGQPGHAEGPRAEFETVAPENLKWSLIPDGLGAQYAVVYGDPSKAGTCVIRVRFPAGVMDLPHSHTVDRHVTVLEGTWYAGVGPNFDPASAAPLGAGSYMFHPAGGVHWDGAAGDEDAVVQIIGNGPVTTQQEHEGNTDWVTVN
jgi:quercetin dioxygenase-like cupin family protein